MKIPAACHKLIAGIPNSSGMSQFHNRVSIQDTRAIAPANRASPPIAIPVILIAFIFIHLFDYTMIVDAFLKRESHIFFWPEGYFDFLRLIQLFL